MLYRQAGISGHGSVKFSSYQFAAVGLYKLAQITRPFITQKLSFLVSETVGAAHL